MRTNINRLIALILAMAMCLSLFGTNAWAAESASGDSSSAQCCDEDAAVVESEEEEVEKSPEENKVVATEKWDNESEKEQVAEFATQENIASGDCGAQGDKVTWTLDSEGTLTISGNGAMNDYGVLNSPWHKYSTQIKKAIIESGVTSIGREAFNIGGSIHSCGLESVIIADSVTSIGDYAFWHCENLSDVTIGSGVTRIGRQAFDRCSSLTSVTIPASVKNIGRWAFRFCEKLTSISVEPGNKKFRSNNGVLFSKSQHDLICYPPGKDSQAYTIPDGVGRIREYAFCICRNLQSISIPDSVTHFEDAAFSECSNLTSVSIPDGVITIGQGAFNACISLTSVIIPDDSVLSIKDSTFSNCTNLTSVSVPMSVTSIGKGAFYGCQSLPRINIPNSVDSIGEKAFMACKSLNNINIPKNVTSIGNSTFSGCTSLVSIDIPESVTSVGSSAFSGCTSLVSVDIPESVTSVGSSAFSGCSSLANVDIPDSVTSLESSMFSGCSSLSGVTIPDSVTNIGEKAFYNCTSLTSVTIPGSVISIGDEAFHSCSGLSSIYFRGAPPKCGSKCFARDKSMAYYLGIDDSWTEEIRNKIGQGSNLIWKQVSDVDKSNTRLKFSEDYYYCKPGESLSVSAEYYSETTPNNISWHTQGDQLSFSGTSTEPPSVSGEKNIWWISNYITCKKSGKYTITLDIDGASFQVGITVRDADEPLPNEKKAIIVVPGVCGSELKADERIKYKNNGEKVWVPGKNIYEGYELVRSDYEEIIGCNSNGVSRHMISPVIVDEANDSRIGAFGTATNLVRRLYEKYDQGTDKYYDVRFFSYDWRMSIKNGALNLNRFIEENEFNKVILVCHSMGGLVASQYIKDGNADRVEKLVTVATPYLGSVKALNVLETGEFIDGWLKKVATMGFFKAAGRNLPTIYELLPSNWYMRHCTILATSTRRLDGKYFYKEQDASATKTWIANRHNRKLYERALTTTDSLYSGGKHPIDQVDSYLVYALDSAKKLETIGEVCFREGLFGPTVSDLKMTSGDGTVPEYSATLGSRKTTGVAHHKIAKVTGKDHTTVVSEMQEDDLAWKYITAAIDGKWDSMVDLNTQSLDENSVVPMTKLRFEGNAAYTVTDNTGNVLANISDSGMETSDGYENCFYALDEKCTTVLAFLNPGTYRVNVKSVTSADFECDVIEYSDYSVEKMDNVKEYKLSNVVDTVTNNTAARIVTNETEFQVDCDGDETYETTGNSEEPVFAESVTLNRAEATVQSGKRIQLKASVLPNNITYPVIEWSSSNEKIATVSDSGIVTGVTAGSTIITASVNGVVATARIQVKTPKIQSTSITSVKNDKRKIVTLRLFVVK